jgi:tetratricopeptide (TPR) repeat protein
MDVFLSYNRRDSAHAALLNTWLGGQGVATFFDQRDLGAGQLWLPDLERRVEQDAQAVAVLVGPAGLGNTQQYEYQLALTRQAGDPGFPVIPVILPGTPDWRVPRGFLGLQTWIDFRSSIDPNGLQRLLAAIRREPGDADTIRGTICPYKGLGFFEEADRDVFFGRDVEAEALLTTVTNQRVAALIGRSGAGKSSLVRAGLLPRLRRRAGAGVWDSMVIRPSEEPLIALADALSPRREDEDPVDRRDRLERHVGMLRGKNPDFLAGVLRDRMGAARLRVDRLLIVVDQAEELFSPPWRLTDAAAIRQFKADTETFIRLLLEAAAQGPASVVLTIRSDYFDPLMHSPFAPVLDNALVRLERIADLRPCIQAPAALVGLRFAPGLVERIVEEVGPDESNLPLLQHALERTWQRRAGPLLSADAYVAAGGVAQAINEAAKDCYGSLPDSQHDAARRLFLRLVRPGEGTAYARLLATVPEDADERQVMETFAHPDRRLLFVGEQAGVRVVELAHEALVRGWDTLRTWVEENRENLRVRDAVTDWRGSAETADLIPAGSTLLQRARDLLANPGDVRLDVSVKAYIERSIATADEQILAARRRRRFMFGTVTVVAGVFALISVAATVFYLQAAQQRNRAEQALTSATDAANSLVFDLAQKFHATSSVPVAVVKDILDRASQLQTKLFDLGNPSAALRRSQAAAALEMADTLLEQGQTQDALDAAKRALKIVQALVDAQPTSTDLQRELSVSFEKVGDVQVAQGHLPEALRSYQADLAIAERLAKADPGNAGWQRDLSVSFNKVGDVQVAQGNLPEALQSYQASLAIRERLAKADPGNAGWQRDLSVSFNKVGDVQVAQGNLPEALQSYQAGLAIAERLAKADPGNAGWRRDLSVSFNKVGNVQVAQGNLPEALQSYQADLAIAERLAKADPGNAGWQRDLFVSFEKVGDVQVAQGNLPEALRSYQAGLAIAERLAKADPGNAGWQRDLSVSFSKVGDVQVAQGNLPEALRSYQAGLAVAERLAKADPGNAGWQRDLSVSFNKVGDVQVAQGNLPEALQSYQAGLAIAERLAKADPGNAGWQRDLSISLGRIAEVLLKQGQVAAARPLAERALAVLRAAIVRMPDDPRLSSGLPAYENLLRQTGGTP